MSEDEIYIKEEGKFTKAVKKPFRDLKETFTPKSYCDKKQGSIIKQRRNIAYVFLISTIVLVPTMFSILYYSTEPTIIFKYKSQDFFIGHAPNQPFAVGIATKGYNIGEIQYVETFGLATTFGTTLMLVSKDLFYTIAQNMSSITSFVLYQGLVFLSGQFPPSSFLSYFSNFSWYDKLSTETVQTLRGDFHSESSKRADLIFKVSSIDYYVIPFFQVQYDNLEEKFQVFATANNIITEPESFKLQRGTNTFELTDVTYNYDFDESWVTMDFVTNNSVSVPTSTAIEGNIGVSHELFGYLTINPEDYNHN